MVVAICVRGIYIADVVRYNTSVPGTCVRGVANVEGHNSDATGAKFL